MSEPRTPSDTVSETGGSAVDPAFAHTVEQHGDVAAVDLAGSTIDRYRVQKRLGAGGMGVVYAAYDPALDRKIALKLLPPIADDRRDALETRLRREAQALAQLDHPNVVRVYDVGVASHSLYVAMQLVDGTTLAEHLAAARRSTREILDLFVAAGRGLAAAHAADIVHRDVKPRNILVDRGGRAYIGDFGLARGTEADDAPPAARVSDSDSLLHTEMTRVGAVVGTPAYLSPEQLRGEPATARSDQFGFCVSVWQALFGRHPFVDGAWTVSAATDAMAKNAVRDPIGRRVPARVIRGLRRGLRHDPTERWPSMTALLATLEPRARGVWVAGGLAILGMAAAVVVTALWMGSSTHAAADPCAAIDTSMLAGSWDPRAREALHAAFTRAGNGNGEDVFARVSGWFDRYATSWVAMRKQTCEATFVRGEQSPVLFDLRLRCLDTHRAELGAMARALARTDEPGVIDRALEDAFKLSPVADCEHRDTLLTLAPLPIETTRRARLAAADVRLAEAIVAIWSGHPSQASAQLEALLVEVRAIDYAPQLAHTLEVYARSQDINGDRERAEGLFAEAAEVAARGKDDQLVIDSWADYVNLLGRERKLDQAMATEPFVRAALARAGSRPIDIANVEWAYAIVLRRQGKLHEAEPRLRTALAAIAPTDRVMRADVLVSYSNLLKDLGAKDAALAATIEAKSIFESTYGPISVKIGVTLYNLARQYLALHRCEEAKATGEHELAIVESIYGHDSPDLVLDYLSMGEVMATCFADLPAARRYFDHAVELARSPRAAADEPTVLYTYGHALATLGQPAKADPILVRSLALAEGRKDTVQMLNASSALAELRLGQGQAAAARDLYARVVALATSMQAEAEIAAAEYGRGRSLRALRSSDQAIAPLEHAHALATKLALDEVPAIELELAKALWEADRDRARARALATDAAARFAKAPGADPARGDAAAWLAAHATP